MWSHLKACVCRRLESILPCPERAGMWVLSELTLTPVIWVVFIDHLTTVTLQKKAAF